MTAVPDGYCQCGCGERTRLAPQSCVAKRWTRGVPLRYIGGHQWRSPNPEYLIDETTGCWVWQRKCNYGGYGLITNRGAAHRVIYERHRGPIADGLELDHLCRNRKCVNPDHLEPVNHGENMRRGARAKLSWDDVTDIRQRAATGESTASLALAFKVTRSHVRNVIRGDAWPECERPGVAA